MPTPPREGVCGVGGATSGPLTGVDERGADSEAELTDFLLLPNFDGVVIVPLSLPALSFLDLGVETARALTDGDAAAAEAAAVRAALDRALDLEMEAAGVRGGDSMRRCRGL